MGYELLQIRTGCRLHLGLMELKPGEPLRFAGLGLMLAEPSLSISFRRSSSQHELLSYIDDAEVAKRIAHVVELRRRAGKTVADCKIELLSELPLHNGLGAGTQLACATASGLELMEQLSPAQFDQQADSWQSIKEFQSEIQPRFLVELAGRGLRSAVGLHGFLHGGLILDNGYAPQESAGLGLRTIDTSSVEMCAEWRVVLLWPSDATRISGPRETELIAELSKHHNPTRQSMHSLARRALDSANRGADFATFSTSIEQYMQLAAQLFAPYQGGMYNGPQITEAVECARTVGLRGVGQSSWGSTVFGFASNHAFAHQCYERIKSAHPEWSVLISKAVSHGAQWRICKQA